MSNTAENKPATELAETQAGKSLQQSESAAIMSVIERVAMNPDADINKLQQMLDMQERVLNRNAKQSFTADLAAMQVELPRVMEHGQIQIKKDGRVIQTTAFAKLEDINDAIRPVLHKYGFAITFRVKSENHLVWIKTILSHREGHSEETSIPLPLDSSGSKNAVQSVGSTISYGKRYGLCAMLNISTGDDTDGAGLGAGQIDVTDWLSAIEAASDLDELKRIFAEAQSEVKADKAALRSVIAAKDARKRELSS